MSLRLPGLPGAVAFAVPACHGQFTSITLPAEPSAGGASGDIGRHEMLIFVQVGGHVAHCLKYCAIALAFRATQAELHVYATRTIPNRGNNYSGCL